MIILRTYGHSFPFPQTYFKQGSLFDIWSIDVIENLNLHFSSPLTYCSFCVVSWSPFLHFSISPSARYRYTATATRSAYDKQFPGRPVPLCLSTLPDWRSPSCPAADGRAAGSRGLFGKKHVNLYLSPLVMFVIRVIRLMTYWSRENYEKFVNLFVKISQLASCRLATAQHGVCRR